MRSDYAIIIITILGFSILGVQTFLIARMLSGLAELIVKTHP